MSRQGSFPVLPTRFVGRIAPYLDSSRPTKRDFRGFPDTTLLLLT